MKRQIDKVCVLNGSRQEDSLLPDGKWETQKVTGEYGLTKGIYRLDSAQQVSSQSKELHQGAVIHVDERSVFQKTEAGMVKHNVFCFKQKPEIGENAKIQYENGRAMLTNRDQSQSQAKSKSR